MVAALIGGVCGVTHRAAVGFIGSVDASQFVAKPEAVCQSLKNWFPAHANVRHVDRFGFGIRFGV